MYSSSPLRSSSNSSEAPGIGIHLVVVRRVIYSLSLVGGPRASAATGFEDVANPVRDSLQCSD